MTKILITGGAGYLGSILVPKLLDEQFEVTVIDNFMYRQNSLLECCNNKNFNIVKCDARNISVFKKFFFKSDIIIPLAALVGMPACKKDPGYAFQINYEAIESLVNLKSKEQLLIYPNTNSGYGQGEGAIFTESSILNPISIYGKSKVKTEELIMKYDNVVTFRLATVFGVSPRMRLDLLVNDFVHRAWRDGFISLFEPHFKRNYVHIRDVADLFIWSINNWDKVNGEIFNFGLSNSNLSKKELCKKIKEKMPEFHINEVDFRKDPDQRNYIVSNDKIERAGFSAYRTVESGIDELIKSFEILQLNNYSN